MQYSTSHSRSIPTVDSCRANYTHDLSNELLSLVIVVGLFASYCPQFYRIIKNKSSGGISPYFLLLGATSSACSLLNIISLQFGQVECCQYLTAAQCFESTLGILQVFIQWSCFNTIFVLYLYFYPRDQKFVRSVPLESSSIPIRSLPSFFSFFQTSTPPGLIRTASSASLNSNDGNESDSTSSSFNPNDFPLPGQLARNSKVILSPSYRLALSLFTTTMLHFFLSALTTLILLLILPTSYNGDDGPSGKEHPSERAIRIWALVLGLSSAALGIGQYLPQLFLTSRSKLVGSLSIPMMLLQVPGSFLFVYTLINRPGVDWTTWGTYGITGVLQGTLLLMCITWKSRQKRLGIDDWGMKLDTGAVDERSRLI